MFGRASPRIFFAASPERKTRHVREATQTVTQECCNKPCTMKTLLTYCAAPSDSPADSLFAKFASSLQVNCQWSTTHYQKRSYSFLSIWDRCLAVTNNGWGADHRSSTLSIILNKQMLMYYPVTGKVIVFCINYFSAIQKFDTCVKLRHVLDGRKFAHCQTYTSKGWTPDLKSENRQLNKQATKMKPKEKSQLRSSYYLLISKTERPDTAFWNRLLGKNSKCAAIMLIHRRSNRGVR